MIKQRIIKKGKRIGMFVALRYSENDKATIGYSLCSKEDTYNDELAEKIAVSRAISKKPFDIPFSLIEDFDRFYGRAKRYYKDDLL